MFAGLVGAITWNLITWYYGLPSSSSHALIGGVVGAAFAAEGADAVIGDGLLGKVVVPAIVAPMLAFVTAAIAILFAYRIIGRQSPGPVNRGFRVGQIASGGMLALAHGTNDAQKTMGVITLALIANGTLAERLRPADLGDRLVGHGDRARHLRGRLADHPHDGQPHHQDGHGAGLRGPGRGRRGDPRRVARRLPLSTTHTISGAVMGAGAAKRVSAVRWGVAGNIVIAWVLTIPASALVGGGIYAIVVDLRRRQRGRPRDRRRRSAWG